MARSSQFPYALHWVQEVQEGDEIQVRDQLAFGAFFLAIWALFFLYELISGENVSRYGGLISTREKEPKIYWFGIALQGIGMLAFGLYLLVAYLRSK
jgi:hypothetical protein